MSDNQQFPDNGEDLKGRKPRFRGKLARLLRSQKQPTASASEDGGGNATDSEQAEGSFAPIAIDFQCTNLQTQSPLFGLLPGEIRNEIFAYALGHEEEEAEAYPKDSYWYRPGFSAPHKTTSALLRTCKIAYIEGKKVFLAESEWAFWFDHLRGPPMRTGLSACSQFFEQLKPDAVESLQKVRFFTQLFWLEPGTNLLTLFALPQFRPEQLTITIRYSDWWWWEQNAPLTMDETWFRVFKGSPGLRKLVVEYETLTSKKDQMMRIVQRNREWKLPVSLDGGNWDEYEGYLTTEGESLEEWKWSGTSKLDNTSWAHHGDGDTVEYVVVTDTWKFVKGNLESEGSWK